MRSQQKVRTAVVTGGHSYDVVNFHALFRGMEELDVYIQHMDDFCSSPEKVRDAYDVVVFYMMMMDGPRNEPMPWYMGKPKAALEHLGKASQGIVVLHHALLAYPEWEIWGAVTGLTDRGFEYHLEQQVSVHVTDSQHPITMGTKDFIISDETYVTMEPESNSHILLTTDHAKSTKALAWTRQYKNTQVFCYQGGHDNLAWVHSSFIKVLRQGIVWAAEQNK